MGVLSNTVHVVASVLFSTRVTSLEAALEKSFTVSKGLAILQLCTILVTSHETRAGQSQENSY